MFIRITRRRLDEADDERPDYPVETLRHWYVTPFGGMSTDLGLFQVGINREALEANTSLDPSTDRVRISIMGRARLWPILLDRFFEVVPLDERKPDALARSPSGEAVLPEGDPVLRRYEPPRPGDDVLLNSVFTQRASALPSSEEIARILLDLFCRESERRPPDS